MCYFEQLYDEGFFPSEDGLPEDSTGLQQAKANVIELGDQIIERLGEGGEELFDEFLSAKAEEVSFEIQTAFAQGAKFVGKVLIECLQK